MPRVDSNTYVVEVASVLVMDSEQLRRLTSWALAERALVVTGPSIVSVRSSTGSMRLALGIGSLVSRSEPPVPYYVITAPEWVDGCYAGALEPSFIRAEAQRWYKASGIAVAMDFRDPAALMLNGQAVEALLPDPEPQVDCWLLTLGPEGQERGLLGLLDNKYLLAARGRAGDLLEYILTLYSSCGGLSAEG